nr:integrase, catalytic region, zinc finger, CCHC-type, peptidase aspartic, catalytic [Tanacetum cinerariifolium]
MLLEGSELTKDERKSQLYDDFEHIHHNKGETIHEYYVRFTKLINDIRNIKMTMPKMQLNSKFVNNMLPEWGRFVTLVKLNRGLKTTNYDQLYAYLKQHEAHANENKMMLEKYNQHAIDPLSFVFNFHLSKYFKDKMLVIQAQENEVVLDEEQLLFIAVDQCDTFDSDVDEAPTTQIMFMVNLSSTGPIYDDIGPSYDSVILSEYVKDNTVQVVQSNVSLVPNDALMMIINDMHKQAAQCVSANEQNKIVDNCKKGLGYKSYNVVSPPYTGSFMPPKPDLSFTGLDEFVNKPVAENTKSSEEEPKVVRKNNDALIIKEWVSDNEEEEMSQPKIMKKTVKPSIPKI